MDSELLLGAIVCVVLAGWTALYAFRRFRFLRGRRLITRLGGEVHRIWSDGEWWVKIDLSDVMLFESDLRVLRYFTDLCQLNLRNTGISNSGVKWLLKLHCLEHLDLADTSVSDGGVKQLTALTALWHLGLDGTHVTDDCISALSELPELAVLSVRRTIISKQGIEELHRRRSTLSIFSDQGRTGVPL